MQKSKTCLETQMVMKVLGDKYLKVALGVCFALKFVERRLTSFHIFVKM